MTIFCELLNIEEDIASIWLNMPEKFMRTEILNFALKYSMNKSFCVALKKFYKFITTDELFKLYLLS